MLKPKDQRSFFMPNSHPFPENNLLSNTKFDLPAGLVVFLVAVPLCLGIALASGAPFFSGLIAGLVGGLIIPLISQSQLSVSGPAAGLTAVVLAGITDIGSFEGFLLAGVIAGVIQVLLSLLRAGFIAYFFPSAVIKGMLTAIGLILILKQVPHAVGYDIEIFGKDSFQVSEEENTLTLFLHSLEHIEWGAFIISAISLPLLIIWEKVKFLKDFRWLPGALVVVVLSVLLNQFFGMVMPGLQLEQSHLVTLPEINSISSFLDGFTLPDWSMITHKKVWIIGLTVGIIASIETLLTIEAIDKIDPYKRRSPLNKELLAQGIGNAISGLIGGLPVTSVIVRSTAGLNSGAKTKMTAFYHGLFLLISILFLTHYLNMVPLASLAAILLLVGYKLAKPSLFKEKWAQGKEQFTPFIVTVVAILMTDLLVGISIGIVVGLIIVIRTNFHSPILVTTDKKNVIIHFNRDVSFLNKAILTKTLEKIPPESYVIIEGKKAKFIDHDVLETINEFLKEAEYKGITVEMRNLHSVEKIKSSVEFFSPK